MMVCKLLLKLCVTFKLNSSVLIAVHMCGARPATHISSPHIFAEARWTEIQKQPTFYSRFQEVESAAKGGAATPNQLLRKLSHAAHLSLRMCVITLMTGAFSASVAPTMGNLCLRGRFTLLLQTHHQGYWMTWAFLTTTAVVALFASRG